MKPAVWLRSYFLLVAEVMGGFWALLVFVLTVWFTKGSGWPVGGTNVNGNGPQRAMRELSPNEPSIKKALTLHQSESESVFLRKSKEVQLETNEVEVKASAAYLKAVEHAHNDGVPIGATLGDYGGYGGALLNGSLGDYGGYGGALLNGSLGDYGGYGDALLNGSLGDYGGYGDALLNGTLGNYGGYGGALLNGSLGGYGDSLLYGGYGDALLNGTLGDSFTPTIPN
ncbi:uncharacterized protein LOC144395159 [Gasterosteus aculeatus]